MDGSKFLSQVGYATTPGNGNGQRHPELGLIGVALVLAGSHARRLRCEVDVVM
jgi:hypothetical protein